MTLTDHSLLFNFGTDRVDQGQVVDFSDPTSMFINGKGGKVDVSSELDLRGPAANDGGEMIVEQGGLLGVDSLLQTTGSTDVEGTMTISANGTFYVEGGALYGGGTVQGGTVENDNGTVEGTTPGGRLAVNSKYVQGPAALYSCISMAKPISLVLTFWEMPRSTELSSCFSARAFPWPTTWCWTYSTLRPTAANSP